jgi:hypothetical protein
MIVLVYIINVLAVSSREHREHEPYPRSHAVHHSAAATAGEFRALFDPSQRPVRGETQQSLKPGD